MTDAPAPRFVWYYNIGSYEVLDTRPPAGEPGQVALFGRFPDKTVCRDDVHVAQWRVCRGAVVTASDAPASDGYTIDPRARAAILDALVVHAKARDRGPRDDIMAARDRVLALVDGLAHDAYLAGRQHPVRLYDADAEDAEPATDVPR